MASSSSQQPIAASSSSQQPIADSSSSKPMNDLTRYLPLHKAILEGNLESVKNRCDSDEHALEARITVNLDTALHVAVGIGMAHDIVEYLLNKMSMDQVALTNSDGNTVLSVAAIVGNKHAAELLVKKDVNLKGVANNYGWIPLIQAAQHKHKKMIIYLRQFNEDFFSCEGNYSDDIVCLFLNLVVGAEFYDLALEFVKHHPGLATKVSSKGDSLLKAIARKPSAFPSGKRLKRWQYFFFLKSFKEEHKTTLELVRHLCTEITNGLDHEKTSLLLKQPLLLAAELGVSEVVKEIIKSFPDAVWFSNEMNCNALQLAVMNRQAKVFNHIYDISGHRNLLLMSKDICGNNILHLAGKLSPHHKLNHIAGPVKQMQHDLVWFTEVGKLVHPDYKEEKNFGGKTPGMVFSEEHESLVKVAEKWMKASANSSSVAAALIVTIAFAAAITVPGDYNGDGKPSLQKRRSFVIFGVSIIVSLFASLSAIIIFLSILTSRYAEDDFLSALPRKLRMCLVLSQLSVISTMEAFIAAVDLVFPNNFSIVSVSVIAAIITELVFIYSEQIPCIFWSGPRPFSLTKQTSLSEWDK